MKTKFGLIFGLGQTVKAKRRREEEEGGEGGAKKVRISMIFDF